MTGQHGYPPYSGPPPPPRNRAGVIVAIVVAGLCLLLIGGAIVAGVVIFAADDDESAPWPTQDRVLPTRDSSGNVVDPTDPGATADSPTTTPDPSRTLERNALYRVDAMQSTGCAAVSTVPLDNLANVTTYYESVLGCLNRSWSRTLKGSKISFTPAKLEVFSGPAKGSCADGTQYSFYCPGEQTIYMYADEMSTPWNDYAGDDFSHGITRLAATHTIAHEFGHHLQQLTGILEAMGPDWPGTELERRSELQASCLGNVWMSAQRDAYPVESTYWDPQWQGLWRFITRVPNHGSESNQQYWTDAGFNSPRPSSCNTWVAGSGKVT